MFYFCPLCSVFLFLTFLAFFWIRCLFIILSFPLFWLVSYIFFYYPFCGSIFLIASVICQNLIYINVVFLPRQCRHLRTLQFHLLLPTDYAFLNGYFICLYILTLWDIIIIVVLCDQYSFRFTHTFTLTVALDSFLYL